MVEMWAAPGLVLSCGGIAMSPGERRRSRGSAAPSRFLTETLSSGSFPGKVSLKNWGDVLGILTGYPLPCPSWGALGVLGGRHLPLPALLLQEEAFASPSGSHPARLGMEPGGSVSAELKLRKPSQRARIPAPFFAHPVGRWLRPRPPAYPPRAAAPPRSSRDSACAAWSGQAGETSGAGPRGGRSGLPGTHT